MDLFKKKELEFRDKRILELEKENEELRKIAEAQENMIQELLSDLSKKDPELAHVQEKRALLMKDLAEFNVIRIKHEKEWDEFQKRYLKFREEFKEFEKWKKERDRS